MAASIGLASWLLRPPSLQQLWNQTLPRNLSLYPATRIRGATSSVSRPVLIPCRASPEDKEEDSSSSSNRESNDPGSPPAPAEDPQELKVISGSPLPGVKAPAESIKISNAVVETIRNQVFSFDTFFATSQEYYEAGVVFRGNFRGEPSASFGKLSSRLKDKFGDEYRLFFISDPEGEKPLAAVVRNISLQGEPGAIPEWVAAVSFGLLTIGTLFLRNSPPLQLSILTGRLDVVQILVAIPGVLVTGSVLLAHEFGHYLAARKNGATLSLPYFIPSWQLGSFGGITRITNVLNNRTELVEIASAGPIAGAVFALTIIISGLVLSPEEGQGILVSSTVFHDSLLVGGIAKLLLGDSLQEGSTLFINPIVLSAWSGLLINAINCIPIGEVDGGRIALGLFGRKAWSRFTGVSLGLLGFTGILNDVALYWVVLVVFLQRGPIAPQANEITTPSTGHLVAGVSVLLLSLLVCCPFPFSFS